LCSLADAVTVNAVPAAADAGDDTVTLFTLMSDVAVMFVAELPLALLFPLFGSLTCSWSAATEAVTANVWLDGVVQVTDQLAPLTVVAADTGSDVSWIVFGLGDEVAQSAGRLRLNVVSAFAGPDAPLLCTVAEAETLKGTPVATLDPGEVTDTLVALRSQLANMLLLPLPLPLLFVVLLSVIPVWSTAIVADPLNECADGCEHVTDQVLETVCATDCTRDRSFTT